MEKLTMDEDSRANLERWLEPYLQVSGDRKSIQHMAPRVEALNYDRLHHLIGARIRDSGPLEACLW